MADHVEVAVTYPIKHKVGDVLVHLKSNARYEITDLPDENVLEETGEPAYRYRKYQSNDKRHFNRRQSEMEEETRFQLVYRPHTVMMDCTFDNGNQTIINHHHHYHYHVDTRSHQPRLVVTTKEKRTYTPRSQSVGDGPKQS